MTMTMTMTHSSSTQPPRCSLVESQAAIHNTRRFFGQHKAMLARLRFDVRGCETHNQSQRSQSAPSMANTHRGHLMPPVDEQGHPWHNTHHVGFQDGGESRWRGGADCSLVFLGGIVPLFGPHSTPSSSSLDPPINTQRTVSSHQHPIHTHTHTHTHTPSTHHSSKEISPLLASVPVLLL